MARAARATAMRCLRVFLFLRRWEGAAVAGWLARRICLGSTCMYASLASVEVAILPLKHAVPAIASSIYPSSWKRVKVCLVTRVGCTQAEGPVLCKCFTPPQITDARCVLDEQSRISIREWLGQQEREEGGDLMGNRERGGGPTLGDARKAALNCAAFRLGQCYVSEGIDTMQKKKERRWSSDGR